MAEIIIGLLTLIFLVLIGIQRNQIIKQQDQIEQLRETIAEYMHNINRFVQAQDEANRAIMATIITISEDNNEKL